MSERLQKIILPLLFLGAAVFFLVWKHDGESTAHAAQYYHNQGHIFGTYYNIRYSAEADLGEELLACMQRFDSSMSMFNKESTISRINRNESMQTDACFDAMFATAGDVYLLSGGAFDITVAPLVNAWGFGFRNKETVTPQLIDSLRQYVGFSSLTLKNGMLRKEHAETMIDASAIAKGQACDVVADYLRGKGCENLLVDIGGEVVCQGRNDRGEAWRVGISKPQDDPEGSSTELQEIICSTGLCMATSGNYRRFYYDGDVRRSHTIDPRTGYPAQSDILSATVVASSCMRADALATACMVLGATDAMKMIESLDDVECYLITSDGRDSLITTISSGFPLGK